jgi:hypothetical protein
MRGKYEKCDETQACVRFLFNCGLQIGVKMFPFIT